MPKMIIERQVLETFQAMSSSLATIASALTRMEERTRIKHDAEMSELEARETFYKRQSDMLEKTNTLFKNPKLEEYLHSLSTMVRDLGPDGMRKMTDASFVYTQEMLKSQSEFNKLLGRGQQQQPPQGFNPGSYEVEMPSSSQPLSLKELNDMLDENNVWKKIKSSDIPKTEDLKIKKDKDKDKEESK